MRFTQALIPTLLMGIPAAVFAAAEMEQRHPQTAAAHQHGRYATSLDENGSVKGSQENQEFAQNKPEDLETRIIGGQPATAGDYPFYVHSITDNLCGGTLIHPDIVLTAAHCLDAWSVGANAIIGATQLTGGDASQIIKVAARFPNPNYEGGTTELNDILLVKLESTSTAPLVTMNFDENLPVDTQPVEVIGFGFTIEDDINSIPNDLQEVELTNFNFQVCRDNLGVTLNGDTQVCAGNLAGGKDSCRGDSGGPLLDPTTLTQYGLVSFGIGCGQPNRPAIYTRVSAFADFIAQTICSESSVPPAECSQLRSYPFLAQTATGDLCLATLIHEDILVTSAQCQGLFVNNDVIIGSEGLQVGGTGETIAVESEFVHPDFDPETLENDLMYVKLAAPSSAPVAVINSAPGLPGDDEPVIVPGFSFIDNNEEMISPTLLEFDFDAVNFQFCEFDLADRQLFDETQICGSDPTGTGAMGCNGDIGSPVFSEAGALYGINSFCPSTNDLTGLFTDLTAFNDFTTAAICDLSDNPPADCAIEDTAPPTQSPTQSPTQVGETGTPTTAPTSTPTFPATDTPTATPSVSIAPTTTLIPTPAPSQDEDGEEEGGGGHIWKMGKGKGKGKGKGRGRGRGRGKKHRGKSRGKKSSKKSAGKKHKYDSRYRYYRRRPTQTRRKRGSGGVFG